MRLTPKLTRAMTSCIRAMHEDCFLSTGLQSSSQGLLRYQLRCRAHTRNDILRAMHLFGIVALSCVVLQHGLHSCMTVLWAGQAHITAL